MRVVTVPVLADNYAYLLIDDETKEAAAVDPAEAALVMAKAREEGVNVTAVLTTHHHLDHAGGNSDMVNRVPGIKVYGGRLDNVSACTDPLDHGNTLKVGNLEVHALHTPGHTKGSISFYCKSESGRPGCVFTGDTMFVGGCGRLFGCTAEDMHRSLVEVLGSLPEDTLVYAGHEYTVKNLEFAVSLEAGNETLKNMLRWAQDQNLARKTTVPSTLQNEWLINPFMRSGDAVMRSLCPGCTPVEVFARLRQQKDVF
eukprot:TRINITY_DN32741_c0_g1_i1.p1 TRINITY_DN32741_c0_g1~~TRINITY_DN32741_c0_g1_i1.p1  ORF type:complete len:256 (-),score=23.58 TRINITY_DN32741_c0_g1_i1:228-995(-)